jgi:16S rRNA (cytosine1402-N4)-methyltransferase
LDVDPQALHLAQERLSGFGERAILFESSYVTLKEQLDAIGWGAVDGILLDLGVSSMQLDTPERGFSFQTDAPLDMRFDPKNPVRAADLVNSLSEDELADLLYQYGEEKRSRQVARAIVRARPLETTRDLAEVVARATRGGRPGMHPATRTFQALRIAVNGELQAVKEVLPQAVDALRQGGRLAVISFHSLEDRIVKEFFRRESRDCICPPRQPVCTCGHKAKLVEVVRHPVQPQPEEIAENPRARSAKLRVAEKV